MDEKRKTLVDKLDELEGSSDWEEIDYEYMCNGQNYDCEEDKILKELGFERDSAPFIYRIHNVEYGPRAVEFWQKAYIVRNAIVNPEFDMDKYIQETCPYLPYNGLKNHPGQSAATGGKSWVIGQEKIKEEEK